MSAQRRSVDSSSLQSSSSLPRPKNSDIVKRGCLYVKRPPSNNPVRLRFKTWQKRYLILRDMWTIDGDTVLELYSSKTAAVNSLEDPCRPNGVDHCCSINLKNVIYVDVFKDSRSFPNAFIVLRTTKSPLIFGAKSELEMREWMMAIKLLADKVARLQPTHQLTIDGCLTMGGRRPSDPRPPPPRVETRSTLRRDDVTHRSTPQLLETNRSPRPLRTDKEHHGLEENSRFHVRVEKTEDSSLHHLEGECYMLVKDTEICVQKSPTSQPDLTWPLQYIRKLKSETKTDGLGDLITLVANGRCGQFQGTYTFRISSGLDLIRRVRMLTKKLEAMDSCCQKQQKDIAKLKNAASSSFEKLLSSSFQDTGSVGHSMQSLVISSGSSSGSQLDQQDDSYVSSSSGQSHMYFSTGNSYLPIVADNGSGNVAPTNASLTSKRIVALSRSMGSLGFLTTSSRRIDSGFESSEEVVALNPSPPIPPPRPIHTIGLS